VIGTLGALIGVAERFIQGRMGVRHA